MTTDRFGNPFAPGLPYARGIILPDTESDVIKLERARAAIARRVRDLGLDSVFNFTGLERSMPVAADEGPRPTLDDELASALYGGQLTSLALEHFGGDAGRHDVVLLNRLTAATFATHLAMVSAGDTVVGVSPTYTHPTVLRSAARVGARFVEAQGLRGLDVALAREPRVVLVVLTRLAVTYDALPAEDVRAVIRLAHERGARVYADDAGGARVSPAVFGQPRTLELGVDVGATGMDKYGLLGPRLGLLGGDRRLVASIRARALEFGLEARPMLYPAAVHSLAQYRPERVRTLVETTRRVGEALRERLGSRVHQTPVTAQVRADDVLEVAMERAALARAPIVPYEATAALAMLLLEDYGILTVHFAGLPPGTSSLLVKFVPPETLERFGGAAELAKAIDASLGKLGALLREPGGVRALLLGLS